MVMLSLSKHDSRHRAMESCFDKLSMTLRLTFVKNQSPDNSPANHQNALDLIRFFYQQFFLQIFFLRFFDHLLHQHSHKIHHIFFLRIFLFQISLVLLASALSADHSWGVDCYRCF